jgi:hypothetical protein
MLDRSNSRRPTSEKRIDDYVSLLVRSQNDPFKESDWFLCRMGPELLLRFRRSIQPLYGFHLPITGHLPHGLVIELVLTFGVSGSPKNCLCRMRKLAATQIGGRIGLFPCDPVQQFEAQLLHRKSYGINDVPCSRYPDRAVRMQNLLASIQPRPVEFMHLVDRCQTIPITLVTDTIFPA